MKKSILSLTTLASSVLPATALAQVGAAHPNITGLNLVAIGNNIANGAWIIFTIVAVIMFLIAGILFLTAAGNPEKVQQARNAFLWGVAGIVVAVIAFAIITIVTSVVTTGQ